MKLQDLSKDDRLPLVVINEAKKPKGKVTRASFVYLEFKEGKSFGDEHCFAQCETCRLWTGDEHKTCMILGKDQSVVGHGSCDLYVNGKPHPDWHGHEEARMTAEEAGYVERDVRCENCTAFKPSQEDEEHGKCKMFAALNKSNPEIFNLEVRVYPFACCNAQQPK